MQAKNPFVGPRPFDTEEHSVFGGREDDSSAIISRILSDRITLLRGSSGVGKTSLLRAGVLRELNRMAQIERTPISIHLLRDWADFIGSGTEIVSRALLRSLGVTDDHVSLERAVEDRTRDGTRLVILIDQFEEVLRSDGARHQGDGGIARLVAQNLPVHVLLSLRNEHLHNLRRLEEVVGGLLRNSYLLQPMTRAGAIRSFCGAAEAHGVSLDTAAVHRVIDAALVNGESKLVDKEAQQVDMFVAQAILFQVWEQGRREPDSLAIDDAAVDAYFGDRKPRDVVSRALGEWIERALVHAPSIAGPSQGGWSGSTWELNGLVQLLAARMAAFMSSGGFKILLGEADVASKVFRAELRLLGHSTGEALFPFYLGGPLPVRNHDSIILAEFSGPALRNRWDVATFSRQLGIAFAETIRRLQRGNVIKRTPHSDGSATVELLHDRLGPPMQAWSESHMCSMPLAICDPIVLRGELLWVDSALTQNCGRLHSERMMRMRAL